MIESVSSLRSIADNTSDLTRLRQAAQSLEASFLSEMLKSAGFGKPREGLGSGGPGEEQFASLLVQTQAEQMVKAGGIGLSEVIFNSLKDQHDARN